MEKEIRPIEGYPYEFTPVERTLNISDVEFFLDKNKSLFILLSNAYHKGLKKMSLYAIIN